MKAISPLLATVLAMTSVHTGVCVALQMPASAQKELRRMRYGLTAAQVVAMGPERFDKYWNSMTRDPSSGSNRGVAAGVFTLAVRDLNDVSRARLPAAEARRLKSLDLKMRFLGVLFARNRWTYSGGNAYDPESDQPEYANAERDLLRRRYPARTPLADGAYGQYRSRVTEERASGGWTGDDPLRTLAKIDQTWKEAKTLVRGGGERRLLHAFMLEQVYKGAN